MSRVLRVRGRSRRIPAGLTLATALVGATVVLGPAPATAAVSTAPRCAELAGTQIPASAISLPTRGGRVESASLVTQVVSGETIEYCSVHAALFPIDPSAPDIKLQIGMPVGWNHNTMMFGGGGYNGTIPRHHPERAVRPSRSTDAPGPWICDVRQRLRPPGGPRRVPGRVLRHERRGTSEFRRRRCAQEDPRRRHVPHPSRLRRGARPDLLRGRLDRRSRGSCRRATVAERLRRRHLRLPGLEQHGRDPVSRIPRAGDVPSWRVPRARQAGPALQQRHGGMRRAGRRRGQDHLECRAAATSTPGCSVAPRAPTPGRHVSPIRRSHR